MNTLPIRQSGRSRKAPRRYLGDGTFSDEIDLEPQTPNTTSLRTSLTTSSPASATTSSSLPKTAATFGHDNLGLALRLSRPLQSHTHTFISAPSQRHENRLSVAAAAAASSTALSQSHLTAASRWKRSSTSSTINNNPERSLDSDNEMAAELGDYAPVRNLRKRGRQVSYNDHYNVDEREVDDGYAPSPPKRTRVRYEESAVLVDDNAASMNEDCPRAENKVPIGKLAVFPSLEGGENVAVTDTLEARSALKQIVVDRDSKDARKVESSKKIIQRLWTCEHFPQDMRREERIWYANAKANLKDIATDLKVSFATLHPTIRFTIMDTIQQLTDATKFEGSVATGAAFSNPAYGSPTYAVCILLGFDKDTYWEITRQNIAFAQEIPEKTPEEWIREHGSEPYDHDMPSDRDRVRGMRFLKQEALPGCLLGEYQFPLPGGVFLSDIIDEIAVAATTATSPPAAQIEEIITITDEDEDEPHTIPALPDADIEYDDITCVIVLKLPPYQLARISTWGSESFEAIDYEEDEQTLDIDDEEIDSAINDLERLRNKKQRSESPSASQDQRSMSPFVSQSTGGKIGTPGGRPQMAIIEPGKEHPVKKETSQTPMNMSGIMCQPSSQPRQTPVLPLTPAPTLTSTPTPPPQQLPENPQSPYEQNEDFFKYLVKGFLGDRHPEYTTGKRPRSESAPKLIQRPQEPTSSSSYANKKQKTSHESSIQDIQSSSRIHAAQNPSEGSSAFSPKLPPVGLMALPPLQRGMSPCPASVEQHKLPAKPPNAFPEIKSEFNVQRAVNHQSTPYLEYTPRPSAAQGQYGAPMVPNMYPPGYVSPQNRARITPAPPMSGCASYNQFPYTQHGSGQYPQGYQGPQQRQQYHPISQQQYQGHQQQYPGYQQQQGYQQQHGIRQLDGRDGHVAVSSVGDVNQLMRAQRGTGQGRRSGLMDPRLIMRTNGLGNGIGNGQDRRW